MAVLPMECVTFAPNDSFADERKDWTYLKWAKEDPEGLKKMKAEAPEAFEELKKHIR